MTQRFHTYMVAKKNERICLHKAFIQMFIHMDFYCIIIYQCPKVETTQASPNQRWGDQMWSRRTVKWIPQRGRKDRHLLPHGSNLNTCCPVKSIQPLKTTVTWFPLYEMPTMRKSAETEGRLVVGGGWGGQEGSRVNSEGVNSMVKKMF